MKNVNKKKTIQLVLPKMYVDFSDIKPPTRPAIETMIENLHKAEPKLTC